VVESRAAMLVLSKATLLAQKLVRQHLQECQNATDHLSLAQELQSE